MSATLTHLLSELLALLRSPTLPQLKSGATSVDHSYEDFRDACEKLESAETQERKIGDGKLLKRIFDAAKEAGVLDVLMAKLLGKIGG